MGSISIEKKDRGTAHMQVVLYLYADEWKVEDEKETEDEDKHWRTSHASRRLS